MKWNSLYSSRIQSMGDSDVAAMLKLAEQPEIISFAGGLPDPEVFLLEEIQDIFKEVLLRKGTSRLGLWSHRRPYPFQGMAGGLYDTVGQTHKSGGMSGDNRRYRCLGPDLQGFAGSR